MQSKNLILTVKCFQSVQILSFRAYRRGYNDRTYFQQCLTFSWTTLRDKYCRHPIAVMGVVDTFGHCVALDQLGWRRHPDKFNFTSAPQLQPPFSIPQNPAKDHYGALACQKYTVAALKLCGPTSYSSTILLE